MIFFLKYFIKSYDPYLLYILISDLARVLNTNIQVTESNTRKVVPDYRPSPPVVISTTHSISSGSTAGASDLLTSKNESISSIIQVNQRSNVNTSQPIGICHLCDVVQCNVPLFAKTK